MRCHAYANASRTLLLTTDNTQNGVVPEILLTTIQYEIKVEGVASSEDRVLTYHGIEEIGTKDEDTIAKSLPLSEDRHLYSFSGRLSKVRGR